MSEKYSQLEDEFRLALTMESRRYTELLDAHEKLREVASRDRTELETFQRKAETSGEMVSELTQLVKEQKGRITELLRSKQEQSAEYR